MHNYHLYHFEEPGRASDWSWHGREGEVGKPENGKGLLWQQGSQGEKAHQEHAQCCLSCTGLCRARFVVVQLLCRVQLFVVPWTAARLASLPTTSLSLLKLMSIESQKGSNSKVVCFSVAVLNCWAQDWKRKVVGLIQEYERQIKQKNIEIQGVRGCNH